jgi:tetratricopeptide (TPR) repeat protein
MRQTLDKISSQILRVIPFVLSLVVPLFFLPFTADYFAFNKYYFIAVIGTLSLIAWCVRNLTRGKLHFTTSPALLPLIILVLANIASSVWQSSTQHVSLFGQTSLFFFLAIIYITVTSSQKNRFIVSSSIFGLIISSSLLSLFTLLHYFGLLAKILPFDILTSKYVNPAGGVLPALSVTIPVLIATTLFTTGVKNWILKSALFASVLLMIVSTVINISLLLPQNGQPVISILPSRAGWSIAVDTFKNWRTALLGTGPETYLTAFTRLRPAYLNLDKDLWTLRFSESGNFLFTLITTTGLLGALAFLFSFLRPLIVSLKQKDSIEDKNTYRFLFLSLFFVLLSFLVIPTGIVSLSMGVILLICLTLQEKIDNQKSVKDISFSLSANSSASPAYNDLPETAKVSVSTSFLPWLIAFFAVAILSAYWFFAGRMYLASVNYKEANTLVQTDAYNAYLKYQKASELDTFNPYYPQRLSQIYLSIADAYLTKENPTAEEKASGADFAQRAIDAGKISAQLDPYNVTVWENLFTVYSTLIPYAQGSADLAISHALQAASVDSTNPAIYLRLGTLFYNLGDADQAIKFIDRARELKQNWELPYFNLSSIYKARKDYTRALQYAQAGLQYTDPKSADMPTIQEEIKALQKLAPAAAATQSATIN